MQISGSLFRLWVVASVLWSINAIADDLPSNLLLKCEGNLTVLMDKMLDAHSNFETMLHLRDGELVDTETTDLTTGGCQLKNGIIICSSNSVVPSTTDRGSVRRELKSYLARETGEYNLFLEMWDYEGRNATGKQTGNTKWHRQGVCRVVSKPIF
jgi:hypothetical protein